jgi:hypothetical protein
VLLTGSNPVFAVLVIGTILAAIIFSHGRGQRTKMILGGIGVAAAMVGLALFADVLM